jgi:hypothetical protein
MHEVVFFAELCVALNALCVRKINRKEHKGSAKKTQSLQASTNPEQQRTEG